MLFRSCELAAILLLALTMMMSTTLAFNVKRLAPTKSYVLAGNMGFVKGGISPKIVNNRVSHYKSSSSLQMNFFEDAFRFFSNMKKEASAKHILVKGPDAAAKLTSIKAELEASPDVSAAFSEMASKFSECPSATRGGNLGTFKPGMMVKEFDKVCFEEQVGKVHGPIQTQFGHHLILITRRYEGEEKK